MRRTCCLDRHNVPRVSVCGACAGDTVGAELANIMLLRGSTRHSGTPLGPFVSVVCVLLYGYILLRDVF